MAELDHDHVRAAKASRYKELRIRVYETTSYVRIIVEVKPLNACYCTFTTVQTVRYEKDDLNLPIGSLAEIKSLVGEHLLGDAPLF